MSLKLVLPIKILKVNGKEIKIPKLGLKHQKILNSIRDPGDHMRSLVYSICPGLSAAEGEYVLLHLLAFNGKIKDKEIDGHLYKIDDVRMVDQYEFQYQGNVFKFRKPTLFEGFASVDLVLKETFESVNGEHKEIDFMKMPAFIHKWSESLVFPLVLDTPRGPIKGLTNILGLFE